MSTATETAYRNLCRAISAQERATKAGERHDFTSAYSPSWYSGAAVHDLHWAALASTGHPDREVIVSMLDTAREHEGRARIARNKAG